MILNGQKNTGEWSAKNAGSSFSLNGAGSKRSFRKLSIMSGRIRNGGSLFRYINTCIYPDLIMRSALIILLIFVSCSTSRDGLAQSLHTSSNKALRLYNEALTYYDYSNLDKAEEVFLQAVALDPKFYEAYMMLGEINTKRRNYIGSRKKLQYGSQY